MRNIEEFIDQQVLKDSKEIGFINSLIFEVMQNTASESEIVNRGNASEFTTYVKLLEKFHKYCAGKQIKLKTFDFETKQPISLQAAKRQSEEKIDFYIGKLDRVKRSPAYWKYEPGKEKSKGEREEEKEREKNFNYMRNKLYKESELAVEKLFNSTYFIQEYLLSNKTVKEIAIKATGTELSGESTSDLEIRLILDNNPKNDKLFRISLKRGNPQAYATSRYISGGSFEEKEGIKLPPADGTIPKIEATSRQELLKSLGGGPIKLFNLFGFEDLVSEQEIEDCQEIIHDMYKKYTTPPFIDVSQDDETLYKETFERRSSLVNQMFDNFSQYLEEKLKDPQQVINAVNVFYNLMTRSDPEVKAYIDLKEGPSILFTPLMELYAGHIQSIEIKKIKAKNPHIIFSTSSDESIKKFTGKQADEKEKLLDSSVQEQLNAIIKESKRKLASYKQVDEDKYNRLYDLFSTLGISALEDSSDKDLKAIFFNIKGSANKIIEKLQNKKIFEIQYYVPYFELSRVIRGKRSGQEKSELFYLKFEKERKAREDAKKTNSPLPDYSSEILNLFKPLNYDKARPATKEKYKIDNLDTMKDYQSFKRSYFARGAEKRYSYWWNYIPQEEKEEFKDLEDFISQNKIKEEEARKERISREGQTKFLVQDDFKKFIFILNEMYEFEKTDRELANLFSTITKILTPKINLPKKINEEIDPLISLLILEKLNEKEYSKVMKKVSSSGAKGLISAVPSNKTANTIAVRFDSDESIDAGIKKVKSSLRSAGYQLDDKRVLKFDQNRDTTDVIKNGEVVARLFFRADIKERKGLAYEHIIGAVLTKKITSQLKNRIDLPPDASKEEVMKKLRSEEFGKLFDSAKKAAPIIRQKVGNIVSAESVGSTNNKADFVLKTDSGKTIGLSAKYAAGEKDNEYKMNKVLGFGTEEDSLVRNPKGIPWWIVGRKTFLNKLKKQTSAFSGREYNPDPEDLDAPAWMKTAKESHSDIYKETMEEVYATIRNILTINLKKLGLEGLIAFVNEADLGKEEERENYDTFLKVVDGPSGLSVTEINLDGVKTDGFQGNINLDQIVVQDRSDIIIKIPNHEELKINSVKFKSDMLSSKAGDLKIKTR